MLLLWAGCHLACTRASGKAGGAASAATQSQGLFGRFEAQGKTQAPEDCLHPAAPTEQEDCAQESSHPTVWPLKGYAVIRDARGDSIVLALDSAGEYRVPLPAGFYTVCVEADGLAEPDRCRANIEVKAGAYTPFSRPFPMP